MNNWGLIIVGGLLSSLSGFAATYFQSTRTLKNRMQEVLAGKKIIADGEAYSRVKRLQGLLYGNLDEALAFMLTNEEWFFNKRLFLPGNFPNKWMTARNRIGQFNIWRKTGSKTAPELVNLLKKIEEITVDAMDEVYKDVGEKRIEIEEEEQTN